MADEVKKPDTKPEDEKKAKKEEPKEVKKVIVKSTKAKPLAPIDPRTGTRFEPGSARQVAMEIILREVRTGKNVKVIRDILANSRKDKGSPYNLDAAYFNYCVACHPEMFDVFSDGVVKLVKEPKVDPEAAAKFEQDKEARRKKAEEAREVRRNEKAEKDGKEAKNGKDVKKAEPDKKEVKKEVKK